MQQKGKLHIAYMVRVANRIWEDNEFRIDWRVCLNEAFRRHRERIIAMDAEARKADPYYERNQKQMMKHTIKIPLPPRIEVPYRAAPAPIPFSPLND